MSVKTWLTLSKSSSISGMILAMMMGSVGTANAQNFDAKYVLTTFTTKEQFALVQGTLNGLAYARFLRDRPDETSMECIQDWLGKDTEKRWKTILASFTKFSNKPPAVILHVLTKKDCGE